MTYPTWAPWGGVLPNSPRHLVAPPLPPRALERPIRRKQCIFQTIVGDDMVIVIPTISTFSSLCDSEGIQTK